MQTAVVPPSAISGAVVARRKPALKRRRAKAAPEAEPIHPGTHPSPLVLSVQRVVSLALSSKLPFERYAAVKRVRNQIAALGLTISDLNQVAAILAKVINEGPYYQPEWEMQRLSPLEAGERIVQPYGVARRVYWDACWLGYEACVSEAARRPLKDRADILERLTLVVQWPGMVRAEERQAVIRRLTNDINRMVKNKFSVAA